MMGLPVIELDKIFWRPGLAPTPVDEWRRVQQTLIEQAAWIMDGDLGPYDAVDVRLRAADTVIFLDFPIILCAWRAFWRSRERWDFWRWLLSYRGDRIREAIAEHAPTATVYVLRSPKECDAPWAEFLSNELL
jgi:adenylate kinase family enzyme